MPYLVRLADSALRDMEAIYEFIDEDYSGKQEASPSAFWEEAQHLQNYLRRRQTQRCCERSSHPARCEGGALHKGKKTPVGLLAFSVCFAPGILAFHAPGHLRFAYLESENPAWTLRLFGDWLADRVPPRPQFVGRAVRGRRHFSRTAPRMCSVFCVLG